uniref:Uncharacterized protein n=1 Tax=Pectobacterium carotovorum TaxID=554 RepID=A0A0N9NKV7_PECCA|nr:Hypothetical protein [Pectobacterium carotovorum]
MERFFRSLKHEWMPSMDYEARKKRSVELSVISQAITAASDATDITGD